MAERSLAHDTLGHESPCHRDFLAFKRIEIILDIGGMMRAVIFCYCKRVVSLGAKLFELLTAHDNFTVCVLIVSHCKYSFQ